MCTAKHRHGHLALEADHRGGTAERDALAELFQDDAVGQFARRRLVRQAGDEIGALALHLGVGPAVIGLEALPGECAGRLRRGRGNAHFGVAIALRARELVTNRVAGQLGLLAAQRIAGGPSSFGRQPRRA